jgi:hypothetical protein
MIVVYFIRETHVINTLTFKNITFFWKYLKKCVLFSVILQDFSLGNGSCVYCIYFIYQAQQPNLYFIYLL